MIDASREQLNDLMKLMKEKVDMHKAKNEKALIFTYLAGHGAADS